MLAAAAAPAPAADVQGLTEQQLQPQLRRGGLQRQHLACWPHCLAPSVHQPPLRVRQHRLQQWRWLEGLLHWVRVDLARCVLQGLLRWTLLGLGKGLLHEMRMGLTWCVLRGALR